LSPDHPPGAAVKHFKSAPNPSSRRTLSYLLCRLRRRALCRSRYYGKGYPDATRSVLEGACTQARHGPPTMSGAFSLEQDLGSSRVSVISTSGRKLCPLMRREAAVKCNFGPSWAVPGCCSARNQPLAGTWREGCQPSSATTASSMSTLHNRQEWNRVLGRLYGLVPSPYLWSIPRFGSRPCSLQTYCRTVDRLAYLMSRVFSLTERPP